MYFFSFVNMYFIRLKRIKFVINYFKKLSANLKINYKMTILNYFSFRINYERCIFSYNVLSYQNLIKKFVYQKFVSKRTWKRYFNYMVARDLI